MKLTFPHMGSAYIPITVLLDTLNIDYVMPPLCSRSSLESGIAHSPEFICMPFKLILGDLIYGLEHGADTVLFGGSCGQCRQEYYGDLLCEILRGMGYQFQYIHLNLRNIAVDDVYSKLRPANPAMTKGQAARAVLCAASAVFEAQKISTLACRVRCREMERGQTDAVMSAYTARSQSIRGHREARRMFAETARSLRRIPCDKNANPLKVALIGEIFIASEPFSNLEVERKLGNLGVEVVNYLSPAMWIREHLVHKLVPFLSRNKAAEAAREFMGIDDVGGHGIETIGNAAISGKKGFDGAIQLYPFTCMPEIIAQCTFGEIQQKYGIPVMTLILDEMTGEAGYMTRLEAFTDMLSMRRDRAAAGMFENTAKTAH